MDECHNLTCVKAPAKINVGLRIVGRRNDGFHLIESLFWPVDLCDLLEFLEASADSIQLEGTPGSLWPSSDKNLIKRTLDLIRKEIPIPFFRVGVKKNIPIGAGLGGGSSDAAAVLRLFADKLGAEKIRTIAAKLGADVPFFLGSERPAWITGIGDVRKALDIDVDLVQRLHIVLVVPPFAVSTAQVFSLIRAEKMAFSPSSKVSFSNPIRWQELMEYLVSTANDLEPFVCRQYPLISEIRDQLFSAGAFFVSMTGSGSCVFGLFDAHRARTALPPKVLSEFCRKNDCRLLVTTTFRAS